MAVAGTINARLDASLKRRGGQVLDRCGVSTTEAIRRLYEYLDREQAVPEWMRDVDGDAAEIERKRRKLRSLAGCVALPADCDARADYREHLLEKHAPGVRL